LVLPTAKLLNALQEADLNAVEKVVDPPVLVTERGLMSDLLHKAGGVTVVRDIERSLKPLVSGARFDVTADKIQLYQQMIRHALHEDELTLKDSPAMTATEVQVRYELMMRVLGSTLSRIESGALSPTILLVVAMMLRAGRIEPPPQGVVLKRATVDIEYLGPLARAQRTDDVASIERLAAFVAQLAKLGVLVADEVFDAAAAVRQIAKRLNCPAEVLLSPEEQRKRRNDRLEAMAKAQRAELARAHGEAASAVGQGQQDLQAAEMGQAPGEMLPPMPAQPPPLLQPTFQG
jgi:hypothetical protein